jgi:hypothetical protein
MKVPCKHELVAALRSLAAEARARCEASDTRESMLRAEVLRAEALLSRLPAPPRKRVPE